ncbi:hypothetical protein D3C71_776780 [compost metagenome]
MLIVDTSGESSCQESSFRKRFFVGQSGNCHSCSEILIAVSFSIKIRGVFCLFRNQDLDITFSSDSPKR